MAKLFLNARQCNLMQTNRNAISKGTKLKYPSTSPGEEREMKKKNVRTHIHRPGKTKMVRKLKFLHIKVSDSRIVICRCEMNCTTKNHKSTLDLKPISTIHVVK